jgi:hypothetical protein
MEEAAKNGHRGLHLLVELSKQAATIGQLEDVYTLRGTCRNVNIEMLDNLELIG